MIYKILRKIITKIPMNIKLRVRNYLLFRLLIRRPLFLLGKPNNLQIELTDRCNLTCSYCPKGHGIGLGGGNIEFDLFKKIIDESSDMKVFTLVGFGEPLLYPHLIKAIEYIKDKYPNKEVALTSNCILLTEKMSIELINSGLDLFVMSMNVSSADKYLEYSHSHNYDNLVNNTHTFLRILNKGNITRKPKTFIQILNTINTEKEISEFCEYWGQYLHPNAEILASQFINWGGVVSFCDKNAQNRYPCTQLYHNRFISREGNAVPCCSSIPYADGGMILGNVKDNSINDLYTKGRIRELQRMNLYGKLQKEIDLCSKCDSWKTVPNIWIKNPFKFIKREWF